MARIVILLPRDEMLETARAMAEKYGLDVIEICAVHTSTVLDKLRAVTEAGADIIVARGVQAMLIRRNSALPVVEVRLTGLEVAMLVLKARALAGRPDPSIGLVGFRNMFSDIERVRDLYDVKLVPYFVDAPEQLADSAQAAINDGMDVLIGGDVVCSCASGGKCPSVFIDSCGESIEEACRTARQLAYAVDQQKRNTAELRAILDYTFSGIIQIDAEGVVSHLNHSAEQMLGKNEEQAIGRAIWSFAPSLSRALLEPVLREGQELYSLRLKLNKAAIMASVAPILEGSTPAGAIISINEGRQVELYAADRRNELLFQGYLARFTFDDLVNRSPQAQAMIAQARHFAKFNAPVLILGEFGTEKAELAQSIHNAGDGAANAFVSYNCGAHSEQQTETELFGPQGLVSKAQGVLFLEEISRLSLPHQYRVFQLIAPQRSSSFGDVEVPAGRVRIIASDSRDLAGLVREGSFREDLFYAVSAMTLRVPPLRERPEDIVGWGEYFLQELQKRHGRYIHLSREAWRLMKHSEWSGNLAQLRNLCERLVVLAPRRNVDEIFLQSQLRQTMPPVQRETAPSAIEVRDPRLAHVSELLQKHGGNRTAVASELGVSKTTLWRYMKKLEGLQKTLSE